MLRGVQTVHNKCPKRSVRMSHIIPLSLFLLMNMDLTFHNLAKCDSEAAHEEAWLVICSSASVLTVSSKQKEVEDLNATPILIKTMNLHTSLLHSKQKAAFHMSRMNKY